MGCERSLGRNQSSRLMIVVSCDYCNQEFFREPRRANEANKFGWKQFCSKRCQYSSKNKQEITTCSNPPCNKTFLRNKSTPLTAAYCSRSCAVTINNSKYPKVPGKVKNCQSCNKVFKCNKKFCSIACKFKGQMHSREYFIKEIKSFYEDNGRIPLKHEFRSSSAATRRFRGWNNAIKKAGLRPNPILFARKHIATDGHKCDSLSEKIIDDWLYKKGVKHMRSVPYPERKELSADFVIGNYWIEFFGLHRVHKRYDELRREKIKIARKQRLNLIRIYPKDIFPNNNLSNIFKDLI